MAEAQSPVIALDVQGVQFDGWTRVRVRRAIDEMAASFSLDYVDRWIEGELPLPLHEGDAASVQVDGELFISGFVDDAEIEYDSRSHSLSVSGRSKAGDLVDCSAIHGAGHWRSSTILQIASDLVQPYGLSVSAGVGASKAVTFAIVESESVHDALERLSRLAGILVITRPDGGLTLTRAGSRRTRTVLSLGDNILSGQITGSWRDRFSSYLIKGQTAGSNDLFGKPTVAIKSTTTDIEVDRPRPLVVLAEETGRNGIDARAAWESNVRAGRSRHRTYSVQGARCAEGLWQPNTLVHVTDSFAGIDDELLISAVEFTRDPDSGSRTLLTVVPPAAYDVIAAPRKEKKHRKRKVALGGKR